MALTQLVLKNQEPVETVEVFLEENGIGGVFLSVRLLTRNGQPEVRLALVEPEPQGLTLITFSNLPKNIQVRNQ